MIEMILALIAPFVVRYGTSAVKVMPVIAGASWRIPVVRAIVAVFSLFAAILTQMIGEGTVEPHMIETAVYTVFNAVAATALYFWSKNR